MSFLGLRSGFRAGFYKDANGALDETQFWKYSAKSLNEILPEHDESTRLIIAQASLGSK